MQQIAVLEMGVRVRRDALLHYSNSLHSVSGAARHIRVKRIRDIKSISYEHRCDKRIGVIYTKLVSSPTCISIEENAELLSSMCVGGD